MTYTKNKGGPAQPERMKAYHSEWSHEDLMKARSGIVVDDGEAWRYEYTHKDAFGDYDLWYRAPDPLKPKAEKTLRDEFAMAALEMAAKMSWDEDATIRQNAIISATWAYEFADAMLEARDQ